MFEDTPRQQPPAPASQPPTEPEIFVMPSLGPPKPVKPPRKKISLPMILAAGGGLALLVLGMLAFFVLRPPKPRPIVQAPPPSSPLLPSPPSISSPPTTTPAVATITPPVAPPAPPQVLSFGPDDDSDGLTNQEEKLIYNSDSLRPDTDGDDFLDGNEVFHLYSPIAPSPVRLLGSGLVDVYENNEFGYSFFYPGEWQALTVSTSTTRELLVRAVTGEMISFTASDNPTNLSLFDWYNREVPDGNVGELEPIITKGGLSALQTANRLTTYLGLADKVLIVSLNIGDKTQVEYRRTYEMMLNSLAVRQIARE